MANTSKRVFSVVLRVDATGWRGEPPSFPGPPITIHGPPDAPTGFVYDFDLDGMDVSLEAVCSLLIAVIEQEVQRSGSRLQEPEFRSRCRLDIALSVPADLAMFSYIWPTEFVALLGRLGIALEASHYLDAAFEEVVSGGSRST
ncbi:hypothetical protein [Phreatobacter sp.]|uniref:hypothetical protein n=1 Tax=Phreatobacter sp. TaxID=1966341 RepID=UPI0025D1E060|nr:hypothetical protein [Phreatobacter sp.]